MDESHKLAMTRTEFKKMIDDLQSYEKELWIRLSEYIWKDYEIVNGKLVKKPTYPEYYPHPLI